MKARRSLVKVNIELHSGSFKNVVYNKKTRHAFGLRLIYFPGGPYDDCGFCGAGPKSPPPDEKPPEDDPAENPEPDPDPKPASPPPIEPPSPPEDANEPPDENPPDDSFWVLYLMK